MLKRTVLAIVLTLIPLFTAVSTVNAATYYNLFDIFRYLSLLKAPMSPTYTTYDLSPSPYPTKIPTFSPIPTAVPTSTPVPSSTPAPTLAPTITPSVTETPTIKPASPSPTKVLSNDTEKDYIMQEINAYRSSLGLSEVKTDPFTCDFAKLRAKEISANFGHQGFTDRINSKTLPYPSYSKVTENIAMNKDYRKVSAQWKNSSGHAENMRADTPFVCVEKYGNYYAYEGWKP